MIAMCCQLPSTTTSATITSADANPSPSATHATSSNQLGATRNHYTTEVASADPNCGAFMEPSGCNRWQPVANAQPPGAAKSSKTFAVGCDHLPFAAHGKEGVDGSSPSEGSARTPETGPLSFGSTRSSVSRS